MLLAGECHGTHLIASQHWFRCGEATSHYLNQCWPRSMSPYGMTRSQWVKLYYYPESFVYHASNARNWWIVDTATGIILWMRPANERGCYIVMSSLIGWVHTQNDPCCRRWCFIGSWGKSHFLYISLMVPCCLHLFKVANILLKSLNRPWLIVRGMLT